jgi:hypothetical protein
MANELKRIDIGNVPELLRIVEEVRSTNEPRVLRRDSEDVAILLPATAARGPLATRPRTKADHEAFLVSAGSWKGSVDAEEFIAYIYERRRSSSRPPVEL